MKIFPRQVECQPKRDKSAASDNCAVIYGLYCDTNTDNNLGLDYIDFGVAIDKHKCLQN